MAAQRTTKPCTHPGGMIKASYDRHVGAVIYRCGVCGSWEAEH